MVDQLWDFTMSAHQQNDQANPPQIFGIGHNSAGAEPHPLLVGVEPDPLLTGYFTPEQLAAELNVHVRTLARWHALRIGPPRTMIGRKPLYRRSSAQEWLRQREQAVEEKPSRSQRHFHRRAASPKAST